MHVHLIRHGEVDNPDHLVYADLPGFSLSPHGFAQAAATADRLCRSKFSMVVSSPLERAVATATVIAAAHDAEVVTDERLTEWRLGSRWAGVKWDDIPEVFPGELEAYLAHPSDLPFSPESLHEVAKRVAGATDEWSSRVSDGAVVLVSHQDPIHAARRLLTDSGFGSYHVAKPEHCSVSSLRRAGNAWALTGYWAPQQ